jgi:EF-P beta-lysylation protein EpmB
MSNWQQDLSQGFTHSEDLLNYLGISKEASSIFAEQQFKTKVPLSFARRIKKGDVNDPILQQVLAIHQETEITPGFNEDPLQESLYNPIPGLIHKYQSRVLIMLSGACAVHCRYCFRRHFPYQDNNPGKQGIDQIVTYLMEHPQVNEVILSGGDPMILNNDYFKTLIEKLQHVPYIRFFRIHSRIPVVLPSRIETAWIDLWANCAWQKTMVTHINHAQEINHEVTEKINALKNHGWMVLNQSVLLSGVNDNLQAQINLSHALIQAGILPYYLHLLDDVQGAAHFKVNIDKALSLYQQMQKNLSGYMLPKLVKEVPGVAHKTLIHPD